MDRKILLVDDDADLRKTLRILLEPSYDVLEAADGPQALRLIRSEHPRLLLLDIALPEMNGLEVLKAAKDIDPSLNVIMLTGQQDIEVARQALEIGSVEFITKPFDLEYLRAEVRRMMVEPSQADRSPERSPWRMIP